MADTFYGLDICGPIETLAELTRSDDGVLTLRFVVLDKGETK